MVWRARRGDHVRRRLLAGEDARRRVAAAADPIAGDAADGGARAGARHRLHPVLQRAGEPAQLPVRHDGDPRAFDAGPLLLVEPSDGGHRAEPDRPRVRVGVGIAEGAVLQDVLARDRAGVPAVDPRHRPLLFRQRDDDDIGGRVPVFAEDHARVDLDTATRRGRRDWLGGRDGDVDRRDLGGRHGVAVFHRVDVDSAHADVAQHART